LIANVQDSLATLTLFSPVKPQMYFVDKSMKYHY